MAGRWRGLFPIFSRARAFWRCHGIRQPRPELAELLIRRGLGDTRITICEAIGGPHERVRHAVASGFALDGIDPLNLVALELSASPQGHIIPLTPGLPDDWFEHDGQLTKRDVRAVTLATLAPRHGELLWDIGAGSGSVGIEWMLASPANRTIAFERDTVRAARIARNAATFGVPDLTIIQGEAPAVLQDLPPPDAVFIGGGATATGVIDTAWAALRPSGRLVVNGVTLETQAALLHRFRTMGGDLKTIQISQVDPLGGFHALRPAMSVMLWSVTKP